MKKKRTDQEIYDLAVARQNDEQIAAGKALLAAEQSSVAALEMYDAFMTDNTEAKWRDYANLVDLAFRRHMEWERHSRGIMRFFAVSVAAAGRLALAELDADGTVW